MGTDSPKHREEGYIGVEQPRSFAELVKELLEMQGENYAGETFETSEALGKDAVRGVFVSEPGFEDNPKQLKLITDFAAGKMKPGDTQSTKVLSGILSGEYDEDIDASAIKRREQADTIALYGLLNTFRGSREEISKVLGQFLVRYDNPKTDMYEHLSGVNMKGVEAVPQLVTLCREAIREFELGNSSIHISFRKASVERRKAGKERNESALSNLGSVLDDDHEAKPSRASSKRLVGGKHPADSDSDSNELSQVS